MHNCMVHKASGIYLHNYDCRHFPESYTFSKFLYYPRYLVKSSKQFCFCIIVCTFLHIYYPWIMRNKRNGTNPQTPTSGIQTNIFERAERARFINFWYFSIQFNSIYFSFPTEYTIKFKANIMNNINMDMQCEYQVNKTRNQYNNCGNYNTFDLL